MSKVRNYCFTLNNYTAEDEAVVRAWEGVKYLVAGREIAPSTGTPHLQGFVVFTSQRTLGGLKKLDGRIHWEAAVAFDRAIEYCKKEGNYFEVGTPPMPAAAKGVAGGELEKVRWKRIIEAVETDDLAWLKENEPRVYAEGERTISSIRKRCRAEPVALEVLDNEWWYGPTGTGKSRKAFETYPDAYRKDPKERWWDGYSGEEVVIVDDFDKFQVSQGGDMKRWMDHYPFLAPIKGGYMKVRPKKIIVTSNYHPSEIWDDDQTREPIMRRVKIVHMESERGRVSGPTETALYVKGFNPGPQARVKTPPLDYTHNSNNCSMLEDGWSANWQGSSYGQVNMALFDK